MEDPNDFDLTEFHSSIYKELQNFINNENEKISKRKQQIPSKKAKFLQAIGKSTDVLDNDPSDLEGNNKSLIHMLRYTTNLKWKDSEVTNKFNNWKDPEFSLSAYVNCTDYILQTYYGRINIDTNLLFNSMVYVMAHARDFADPRKRLLTFSEGTSDELAAPSLPILVMALPDTPYAAAISECLTQLRTGTLSENSETYQQLNANITYLILLMVRRTVKSEDEFLNSIKKLETQQSYIKLCPYAVHKLPVICEKLNKILREMFKDSAMIYLVMMALLQCEDEKTNKVLNVTCLQHLEWTGLVFPRLFFKVAKFYNVSEGDFWDLLCTERTFDSLIELSDTYYTQYKNMKEDPSVSYKLFPYARAVNGEFNEDLSYRNHRHICYTLAYLHDLHFGLDKSFARKAHWAKNWSHEDKLAIKIYNILKNDI